NYGRTYIEAINLAATSYHLMGILSRGSERSKRLAREQGVPLYGDLEELPRNIDLACTAMGSLGSDVVLGLLRRGIHVLCEHPLKPTALRSFLGAATQNGVCFHINGHFADLDAAAAFIVRCRDMARRTLPCFIEVMATERSLYAALDILRRTLPVFAPFQFHAISRLPPLSLVQGFLQGVPTIVQIQSNTKGRPLPDGSPNYLMDHRIVVAFRSGILSLLSMNGPVVWNANLNSIADPGLPLFTVAHRECALTADLLYPKRVAANLAAISDIVKHIRDGIVPLHQEAQY